MLPVLILTGAAVSWLDRSASEVARQVAHRLGPQGVIVVGAHELATATWTHRIVHGAASTTVRLGSGTTIETDQIGAVLNLARTLPAVGFAGSTERDRTYADTELQALFVSFLRSFGCPVTNRVDGQGPLGLWSPLRWAVLAHQCGLATGRQHITTGTRLLTDFVAVPPTLVTSVVVVGARCFGARSEKQHRQSLDLARLAGCDVLGLTFDGSLGVELLLAVDPFPPLAGEVAHAVAALLCEDAAASGERVAS